MRIHLRMARGDQRRGTSEEEGGLKPEIQSWTAKGSVGWYIYL